MASDAEERCNAKYDASVFVPLSELSTGPFCVTRSSGVARNYRQGVRQSVAFLSVHSRSAALPSRPYIACRIRLESIEARLSLIDKNIGTSARFTRRPVTLRNHTPKNYVFSWQGVCTPLTPLVWLRHTS